MTAAKKIDSKGRLLLSEDLAGVTVIVEKRDSGEYVIKPAITIPADEKWLFENKESLNLATTGLKQAREGKTVKVSTFSKKKTWKSELVD